ncbi:MAG TPA: AtpZ/AtpI family protein [Rickettsiales bacterium]|nr:AtpZ/AtpI family protein [Rickettsiales bacterium]
MTEQEKLPSLENLEKDIHRMREHLAPKPKAPPQGLALAFRTGLELVSGALVGGGCGYFLDKWLGTSPFLFILCFFLGCAGGFMTLYRTLGADKEL